MPDECPRTVGRSLGGVQGQEVQACVSRHESKAAHISRLGGLEFASAWLP